MNTGWELGRGKRAGEKDLVDTGGGGGKGRVGNGTGGKMTEHILVNLFYIYNDSVIRMFHTPNTF